MKFPNFLKTGKSYRFFLLITLLCSSLFFLATTADNAAKPQKIDADWIRCSQLGVSINSYISSISGLTLCSGRPCLRGETSITFTVSYYVDQYNEVDLEDVETQIMTAIQNNSNKPCGCVSLQSRGSINCTPGTHYVSITLKYCQYCKD